LARHIVTPNVPKQYDGIARVFPGAPDGSSNLRAPAGSRQPTRPNINPLQLRFDDRGSPAADVA
jgi:hypothetical protein